MKHEPTDDNCVRFDGDRNPGKTCRVCADYDNAVWLTQRERFEDRVID